MQTAPALSWSPRGAGRSGPSGSLRGAGHSRPSGSLRGADRSGPARLSRGCRPLWPCLGFHKCGPLRARLGLPGVRAASGPSWSPWGAAAPGPPGSLGAAAAPGHQALSGVRPLRAIRLSRGCGRSRPALSGLRPLRAIRLSRGCGRSGPSGSLGGVAAPGHQALSGVRAAPAPPRFPRPHLGLPGCGCSGPARLSWGCGRSGLSIFLGSQVSLCHIPPLVSCAQTKDTRLHGKSAQEPRRPPRPRALTLHFREDPAADQVVPWGRGRLGKRLRLPTGAKPMGRPCFLPDAPGGRGSRNQPSCPEPPCHSHSRRQPPCH